MSIQRTSTFQKKSSLRASALKTGLASALFYLPSMMGLWAQDGEKITWEDHVQPLLQTKCFSCHNPDKARGGLDLTSYGAMMKGGSGGNVVLGGDVDRSRLFTTTSGKEEPKMPPEGAPLSDKDLQILKTWIAGGILENKGSQAKIQKPTIDLTKVGRVGSKPDGPPPMPEHVLREPVIVTPAQTAVVSLDSSPWSPLVAIAGQKQALIFNTHDGQLAGVYPYPEGFIQSVAFSKTGEFLIGGVGHPGKEGKAVLWSVKDGKRLISVGKEFDIIQSADVSPDLKMMAIGTTGKRVKLLSTQNGEEIAMLTRHTEWVLHVSFSPDGRYLATADRNGNICIWDGSNGGEIFVLGGHERTVTGLSWRGDSLLLASSSETGEVRLWEMNEGKEVKKWAAHPGGATDVSFNADGLIATSGRDQKVKIWDGNGALQKELAARNTIVTQVSFLSDGNRIALADYTGSVEVWDWKEGTMYANLGSNPPHIAQRIEMTLAEIPKAQESIQARLAEAQAAEKQLADLTANLMGKETMITQSLEREKVVKESEIPALKQEIAQVTNKVAEVKKAQQEHAPKQQAHESALKKVEEAKQKLAESEKKIAEVEAKLSALQNVPAQEGKPEEAHPDRPKLEAELNESKKKFGELNAEIDALTKAVPQAPPPIAEINQQVQAAENQLKTSQEKLAQLEKFVAEVPKQVEGMRKEVEDLKKAVADAASQVELKKQAHAHSIVHQQSLEKRVQTLKAAQFQVGLIQKRDEVEAAAAELEGTEAAFKEATQTLESLKAGIVEWKKSLSEKQAALPGIESEKAAKVAALEKSNQSLAQLTELIKGLEAKPEPLKAEMAQAQQKVDQINQTLTEKRQLPEPKLEEGVPENPETDEQKAKKEAYLAAKAKFDENKAAIAALETELTSVQGNLDRLKNKELPELEKTIAAEKAKLPALQMEQQKAQQAFQEVSDKMNSLQGEMASLSKQIETAPEEMKKQEAILSELNPILTQLRPKVEAGKAEVSKLQETYMQMLPQA